MITIISGTPGAGKTLYTIEKLLLPLVGKTIASTDENGQVVEIPRIVYTNINGLQVDHELIDGGDNQGLRDWHKWAKPGSVIVFDEVQKVWPPRANGSKVPDDIQALDTHRHMGVDFVLITQNVVNIDKHIHALGGRHMHVRRIANMALAIVYEWDHVSRSLMFSKSITKAPWRYDRKIFKLYKSAQLHTKQKRSMPGLVWFILAGIVTMAVLGPTFKARMDERFNPQAKEIAQASGEVPAVQGQGVAVVPEAGFIDDRVAFMPRISNKPETAPAFDAMRVIVNMPQVSGGVCFKGNCKCLTQQGTDTGLTHGECVDWMKNPTFDHYRIAQQPTGAASLRGGNPSAGTSSTNEKNPPEPVRTSITVPFPDGVLNPTAEARSARIFPPATAGQQNLEQGEQRPMPALSLQNPYRRS